MKAGYKIISTVHINDSFFYLNNFKGLQEIELIGFSKDEETFFKRNHACTGVWKIKNLKN